MIAIPSFAIGLTALSSFGRQLSVTSNNLANVNTAGFGRSRADLKPLDAGSGVGISRILTEFGGGGVEPTGISTHLSISGNGFFAVKSPQGGLSYTRSGPFQLDRGGFLVDPQGNRVQGFGVDRTTGRSGGVTGDIRVPPAGGGVRATSRLNVSANLDSNSEAPGSPFDPSNAAATSNFATSATVVDSLGNAHPVEMYFRTSGVEAAVDSSSGQTVQVSRWEWYGVTSENGVQTIQASGTLRFGPDGSLFDSQTADSSFDFGGGAGAGQAVDISFGTPTQGGGEGLDGTTQFASESAVLGISQDGSTYGAVSGIFVDASGTVTARLTNGETLPIARVAVATFASPTGLSPLGGNLFGATSESGAAVLNSPGFGAAGSVRSGGLELSNVDLSTELVQMLRESRGFQSNVRSLTLSDSLTEEILNIRR